MKQLPGDIRNRLSRRPDLKKSISRDNIGEVIDADNADEDGRPGTPGYFGPSPEPETEEDES
ncbi:MAG: hypothetical protein ABEK50_09800, partial [bacterium]